MSTNRRYSTLEEITQTLLDSASEHGVLRDACVQMHELLTTVCGIDDRSEVSTDTHHTDLPNGKAISPVDAARCVLDYMRTTKFIRGVRDAIETARKRFPGEVIEVLYAGCGPFATLALPLTTVFKPEQVRFTLIDVHQRSLDCVAHIAEVLGLSSYLGKLIQADAAAYKCDENSAFHVLIVEALQTGLTKEPQVAIAMNLVPQLCADGILVPEKISLTVCYADLSGEVTTFTAATGDEPAKWTGDQVRKQRVVLGSPFELTADSARALANMTHEHDATGSVLLPCRRIEAAAHPKDAQSLAIFTTITVFGAIVLGEYESGLTCPIVVNEALSATDQSAPQFVYRLGQKPGLTLRVAPQP